MQIAYSLDTPLTDRPTLLTIGKFDGFHRGHQLLIRTAIERSHQCNCCSAVMTFEPHPATIIHPDWELKLLIDLEERIELIRQLNPDILIVAPFTRETMQTSAYDYMHQICSAVPLRELWVGGNFYIGHKREGDIPRLIEIGQELGYTVSSVSPLRIGNEPVSSSRVRRVLSEGKVEEANELLGRPFRLRGVVVEGDKRGRSIGFPTANLDIAQVYVRPASGVYACVTFVEDEDMSIPSVVNVGVRPTFGGEVQTVESHLLDWEGTLYDKTVQVVFLHRLRGEHRFDGVEDLRAQIARDAARAREILT